jgi:hypothetical protein
MGNGRMPGWNQEVQMKIILLSLTLLFTSTGWSKSKGHIKKPHSNKARMYADATKSNWQDELRAKLQVSPSHFSRF